MSLVSTSTPNFGLVCSRPLLANNQKSIFLPHRAASGPYSFALMLPWSVLLAAWPQQHRLLLKITILDRFIFSLFQFYPRTLIPNGSVRR